MKALLLAVLGLLAAVQAAQAEPVFQRGSRIGFTPPPGMVASGTFNEYHDSDRLTSIRLQEWPDSSHARLVSALDAMAARRMTVFGSPGAKSSPSAGERLSC